MSKKSILSKITEASIVKNDEVITVREEEKVSIKKQQDEFYQTYHEFLYPLISLSGKERAVLDYMCKSAVFNTGVIDLSTYVREDMCNYAKINKYNLSKILKNLERSQAIRKIGSGRYMINSLMFWKGDNDKRIEKVIDFYVIFEVIKEVPVEEQNELIQKSKIAQIKKIHVKLEK